MGEIFASVDDQHQITEPRFFPHLSENFSRFHFVRRLKKALDDLSVMSVGLHR